jgi:O-antigen/teichoic acid export membrane protein
MSVLLGYTAGSLGVSGLLRRRVVKHGEAAERPDADTWKPTFRRDFLQYAFPLVPYALLQWTMSLSDRYFLAGFEGTVSVGLYAAAYGLGSQPFIAANTFVHSVLRPVLYDAVAQGDRAKERKTLALWLAAVVIISGAGVGLFVLFSNPIAHWLLGQDFWGSAQLLPWIAGAYALQSVQQTFEIVLYAHGRTRQVVWVQGIAAAVSLLLYVLLIPRFGAWGAALGTLGTFFITAIVSAALARACLRHENPDSA